MIPPTNNTAGGIILLVDSNSKFCIQTIIIAQQNVNRKICKQEQHQYSK